MIEVAAMAVAAVEVVVAAATRVVTVAVDAKGGTVVGHAADRLAVPDAIADVNAAADAVVVVHAAVVKYRWMNPL